MGMTLSHIRIILDKVLTEWTEDCYTTAAYARDCNGHYCDANAPDAITWCVQGALHKAILSSRIPYAPLSAANLWDRIETSRIALNQSCLSVVNDEHGYYAARAILEHARDNLTPGRHK